MGNDVNRYSNNNVKDKHYFINEENQISISVSNDGSNNSNTNIVNIKESETNSNTIDKEQSKTYSLLKNDNNQDNNINNIISIKKERKKLKKSNRKKNRNNPETFYKNIYKKKSIIGICMNLFFWIWSFLLYLDNNSIIKFPRASRDRKVYMIYGGYNSDSFIGSILSTLLYTILNYLIITLYPEIIFFLSYIVYVVYSIYNTSKEKFKENNCLLSKNVYIFLVFLTFGEIYKLFARKYLDI